ncbi:unnamed protein product [Calicophoron daubneyi]|uniref:Uncharacterized protein n=1 Tax=Calicophoron daubneyi TaxID=300641 RepID=A0AAV2TL63_CALDB
MNGCDVHKAFDSLWSLTDEIFKYVVDIRTILNNVKGPVGEILPSDPPSYEDCMPEQFIEHFNQKVTLLENLNEKRKALLQEFGITIESDHLDDNKQIMEKSGDNESTTLRDSALKSLESYTRTRQAALITNLGLLEQASEQLSTFRRFNETIYNKKGEVALGCISGTKCYFDGAMKVSQRFTSHLNVDRVALLKEGKMLEETLLKVPHETNEEVTKSIEIVQYAHQRIKEANLSELIDFISPVLDDYLETRSRYAIRNTINSVVINMQHSFNKHTQMVQAYNQALQALADHLIV